jgi:hypothetical protein
VDPGEDYSLKALPPVAPTREKRQDVTKSSDAPNCPGECVFFGCSFSKSTKNGVKMHFAL